MMADKEEVKKSSVEPAKSSGKVGEGDTVKVHYTGTLDSGEEFDTSRGKDPIEFIVGQHTVIKGFEEAVKGMAAGESKEVTIKSSEAYGDPNPELKQTVPKEALGDIEPEEGMMLALQHPQMEQPMPATVLKVNDDSVELDMNHPLAGKDLNFKLEVVEVN